MRFPWDEPNASCALWRLRPCLALRGIFSLNGTLVPVIDLRRRLGLPDKEVALEDTLVLARGATRLLGFFVDGDTEVADCASASIVPTGALVAGARTVVGIGRLGEELLLIQDPDAFLSPAEDSDIAQALHDFG
jgi:purine-binding chemotaxis protein CheW